MIIVFDSNFALFFTFRGGIKNKTGCGSLPVYMRTCTSVYTHMYKCICAHVQMYTRTCTSVYAHMYKCIHAHVPVYMHTCTSVYTHMYQCICAQVQMYIDIFVLVLTVRDTDVSNSWPSKSRSSSHSTMMPFDGKYQLRAIHFALALTVSEIFTFQNGDFQKIGQGHRVQLSQCFYSIAKIKIYRSRPIRFCVSSNCCSDI